MIMQQNHLDNVGGRPVTGHKVRYTVLHESWTLLSLLAVSICIEYGCNSLGGWAESVFTHFPLGNVPKNKPWHLALSINALVSELNTVNLMDNLWSRNRIQY